MQRPKSLAPSLSRDPHLQGRHPWVRPSHSQLVLGRDCWRPLPRTQSPQRIEPSCAGRSLHRFLDAASLQRVQREYSPSPRPRHSQRRPSPIRTTAPKRSGPRNLQALRRSSLQAPGSRRPPGSRERVPTSIGLQRPPSSSPSPKNCLRRRYQDPCAHRYSL